MSLFRFTHYRNNSHRKVETKNSAHLPSFANVNVGCQEQVMRSKHRLVHRTTDIPQQTQNKISSVPWHCFHCPVPHNFPCYCFHKHLLACASTYCMQGVCLRHFCQSVYRTSHSTVVLHSHPAVVRDCTQTFVALPELEKRDHSRMVDNDNC